MLPKAQNINVNIMSRKLIRLVEFRGEPESSGQYWMDVEFLFTLYPFICFDFLCYVHEFFGKSKWSLN